MAYPVSIFMNNRNHIAQTGSGSPYFDWVGIVIVLILTYVVAEKMVKILYYNWKEKKLSEARR